MKEELTERQKRAADFFVECGSKSKALKKAGYNKSSFSVFEKPEVKEYVKKRLKSLESERIASAKEVMEYLTSVMRGEEKEEVIVMESEGGATNARNVEKSIPVKDRIRAAELLGKRFGIYSDKSKAGENISIIIKDDLNE